MKELLEYRTRLLDRWQQAAREFAESCQGREVFAKIEGSDWNTHQMAAHVRDVDRYVYGERVRRTLRENIPLLKNFDADHWMSEHYDPQESLEKILAEFLKSVAELSQTLREMPDEAWSRECRHEFLGGGLTLQLWVERGLAHIEEHLHPLN